MVNAAGMTIAPGVVVDARWMLSTSLKRVSAQGVAMSGILSLARNAANAISARPSAVREPAIQAPTVSITWSCAVARIASGTRPRIPRATNAPMVSSAVMTCSASAG